MSKLKQLVEQATQKNEMRWRVYAYDPAKDNKLVHTSKDFENIEQASAEKLELLKKNPDYTIEIIAESKQKNETLDDYKVKVIVSNGNEKFYKAKDLSDAKRKFSELCVRFNNCKLLKGDKVLYEQNESSQKNEVTFKPGDKVKVDFNWRGVKPSIKEVVILNKRHLGGKDFDEDEYEVKLSDGKTMWVNTQAITESADIDVKNPGILEVPDGKKVNDLPQSHFEKLVDKKGYAKIIRALTNLEVWNKDKDKSLSSWASNMADKLKKKYRPESTQKNEATFKPGDKVSVKSYYKDGNQFITLRNATIIKEITEKEAGQLDPAYNWKEPTGMKYYLVKLDTGYKKAALASDLTLESAQKNEDLSKHPKLQEVWHRWKFNTKYGLHYTSNAKDTQAYLAKITKPDTFWLEDEDTGKAIVQGTPKDLINFMLSHKNAIDKSAQKNEAGSRHEEKYKNYIIRYEDLGKDCYILAGKEDRYGQYDKQVEVVAKHFDSSKSDKDNMVKAAKAIIDRGNIDFSKKFAYESSQMNETRGYTVTVELGTPDNINNIEIEDEVERLLRASNKINVVMDVTAERK